MILGVTFTRGVSLEKWVNIGIIYREKLIYEEYLKRGYFEKIYWFTYGINDKEIRNELIDIGALDKRIEVVPAPQYIRYPLGQLLYSLVIGKSNKDICSSLDLIKSNQMQGAWAAFFIAKQYDIPFLLRTGYTHSVFIRNRIQKNIWDRNKQKIKYLLYYLIEKRLYCKCNMAEVSSEQDEAFIKKHYKIRDEKIRVLHNYINCEIFTPGKNNKERISDRILVVGRLHSQKNMSELINAASICNCGIDIYGSGEQKEQLEQLAEKKRADVCFKGVVSNDELPEIYRSYKYYALPSLYEGLPKTLIEAMACGCICLGTNVNGISEIIIDGYNGFLSQGTSALDLSNSIKRMMECSDETMITNNAVKHVRTGFSLDKVVETEWNNIQTIICAK